MPEFDIDIYRSIMTSITDVQTVIVAILGAAFLFVYTRFFNWRKTAVGRALVYLIVSLELIALSGALARNLGNIYPGRELVSFIAWGAAIWASLNMLWVLVKSWNRKEPIAVPPKEPRQTMPTATIKRQEENDG